MEAEKNSKLEREARIYNNVYAPDNFQSFVDGAEWAVDEMCILLRARKYQEYPGGPLERLIPDDLIEELRKKVLVE